MFQSLLDGLTQVKSGLWKDIIAIQRQWLGVCNDGVRLEFNVQVWYMYINIIMSQLIMLLWGFI